MKNTKDKFIKSTLKREISITGVYTVHYFKYGKNFAYKGEKHNFWELVYLDSGHATIVADQNQFNLGQGQAFLHKPNQFHNIFTDCNFANSVIISFDCSNSTIKELSDKILVLDDYEKTLLNKIVHETKNTFSDKLNDIYLVKMSKKDKIPFGGEQIIRNNIELLLLSLIRRTREEIKNNKETQLSHCSDKIVESVCNILNEKLDQSSPISLDEISYRLGFSKSYVKVQFKKKTGSSVIQYYISLKIDKAKKLLSQQKYTITEISDMLGFNSVYYFSRQFKLITDMSPTEYINSIKADNVL